MNTLALRRFWLKNRCWVSDIAAGAGLVVFAVSAFWLLDFAAAAIQAAQGIH